MFTVQSLHHYPVKSFAGCTLNRAKLTIQGIKYDREWMVVDGAGKFVSQRTYPTMALTQVVLSDKHLTLSHPNARDIRIPLAQANNNKITVEVWGDYCSAYDEGDEVATWLNQTFVPKKTTLRLVRFADAHIRSVDETYLKGEIAQTKFSDIFPFLICFQSSLDMLNRALKLRSLKPVTMNRFRPNIVLNGGLTFSEHKIGTLSKPDIGVLFGLRKPCQRCKIITIDQQTGVIDKPNQPLKTLVDINPIHPNRAAYFGENATLINGKDALISIGDVLH